MQIKLIIHFHVIKIPANLVKKSLCGNGQESVAEDAWWRRDHSRCPWLINLYMVLPGFHAFCAAPRRPTLALVTGYWLDVLLSTPPGYMVTPPPLHSSLLTLLPFFLFLLLLLLFTPFSWPFCLFPPPPPPLHWPSCLYGHSSLFSSYSSLILLVKVIFPPFLLFTIFFLKASERV